MAMTMRERIARAIANRDELWDPNVQRVYGVLWAKEELDKAYARADAVLSELETPTEGMISDGATGLLRAQDYDTDRLDQYEHAPDMTVTKVEFEHAFHAAIRAAKEGE